MGEMSAINYSKWDNIEISDDEDDTHPNIHTPSLFKWRHEARVKRMDEMQSEKERISEAKKETQARLKKAEASGASTADLEKQLSDWKIKEKELLEKEKKEPLNVDTIGTGAWSKSHINKAQTKDEIKSEEEVMADYKLFTEKYEKKIKEFGLFSKMDDSQRFFIENPNLCCEHTASYLCIWSIDLCVEEKTKLMEQVSHQAVILQFILELAKSLKVDPRGCFRQFFDKFKNQTNPEYNAAFEDELKAFRKRVKGRAESPGGLDPQEVFESLPPEWQECFEKRDIPLLEAAVQKMDPADAKHHLDRCIKSGLWCPGGNEEEEEQSRK